MEPDCNGMPFLDNSHDYSQIGGKMEMCKKCGVKKFAPT